MFLKMHRKNSTRLGFRWLTKSIETIKLYKRSFCRCYSLCFYISMLQWRGTVLTQIVTLSGHRPVRGWVVSKSFVWAAKTLASWSFWKNIKFLNSFENKNVFLVFNVTSVLHEHQMGSTFWFLISRSEFETKWRFILGFYL